MTLKQDLETNIVGKEAMAGKVIWYLKFGNWTVRTQIRAMSSSIHGPGRK
jgi:hypothetical protein